MMITETHHALLFAWIAREVIQRVGESEGGQAIRKAVRRYGEQRGGRMAQRARADGLPLNMADFMVYGEWRASDPSITQTESVEVKPDVRMNVVRCPWNETWSRENLIEYGRLYCQEIDHALVRGFNPDLELDVNRTLTNDGESCEFVYHEAGLVNGETLGVIENRKSRLEGRTVMPWEFHCGHLYKTFSEVLESELGHPGRDAVKEAMDEFSRCYGVNSTQRILAYQDLDFDEVPG